VIVVETHGDPCGSLATNVELITRSHALGALLYTFFPVKSDLKLDKAVLGVLGTLFVRISLSDDGSWKEQSRTPGLPIRYETIVGGYRLA
jgi:hypothetical protein